MLFVLAQFDVRIGHQVVWSSAPLDGAGLAGLEFRMIPSGVHDRSKETIYFVSGDWHGVALYEARTAGNARTADQSRVFALAALVPLAEDLPWGQEPFLAKSLASFLDRGATLAGPESAAAALPAAPTPRPDPRSHPVLATAAFLRVYGPMVFPLWKAGLARSRTLLAAIPGQSIHHMSQFTYIAAQISAVPADVLDLVQDPAVSKGPIPVLYNVTVSDLARLQAAESFWATTTDSLLYTPSRDACDGFADDQWLHDHRGGASEQRVGPTWRDRHRFALLLDALQVRDTPACSGLVEAFVDATATGLLWWASAGESTMMDRDETAPLLGSGPSPDTGSDVVALVGQFQQYTRQLVRVFARIAADDDPIIRVGVQDIAAMGLDPLAGADREFLQRFALAWWDRPVVFTGWCC